MQQAHIKLNEIDSRRVAACLRAAIDGPFFPDWEFDILIGAGKPDVERVLGSLPHIEERDRYIVKNVLLNLGGYPHGVADDQMIALLSCSQEDIRMLVGKL